MFSVARALRPAAAAARTSRGGIHCRSALSRAEAMSAGGRLPEEKLVVLCILDGWGYRETAADNAVTQAHTPHFDGLFGKHSQLGQVAFLDACEKEVGLPVGQIGNSEVGHMNIGGPTRFSRCASAAEQTPANTPLPLSSFFASAGAGRIVYQDICTIDNSIEDGSLPTQEALVAHIDAMMASGGTSHVMGLVSPGGVHAHQVTPPSPAFAAPPSDS